MLNDPATNPRILARPGRVAPVLANVVDHPAVIEEAVSLLNKVYGRDRVGLQASFYLELKNKEQFVVEGTYTLAEADVAAILCNKPDRRATSLADLEHFDFFFLIDEAGDKTTQTAFVRARPPDIPVRVLRDPVDGQRFHLYLGNRPIGLEVVDRLYEEGFERMHWNGDPIKKGYIADHPPRPPRGLLGGAPMIAARTNDEKKAATPALVVSETEEKKKASAPAAVVESKEEKKIDAPPPVVIVSEAEEKKKASASAPVIESKEEKKTDIPAPVVEFKEEKKTSAPASETGRRASTPALLDALAAETAFARSDAAINLHRHQKEVGEDRVRRIRDLLRPAHGYDRKTDTSREVREIPRAGALLKLTRMRVKVQAPGTGDMQSTELYSVLQNAGLRAHTDALLRTFQEAKGNMDAKALDAALNALPRPAEETDIFLLLLPPFYRIYQKTKIAGDYIPYKNPLVCAFTAKLARTLPGVRLWYTPVPRGMALLLDARDKDDAKKVAAHNSELVHNGWFEYAADEAEQKRYTLATAQTFELGETQEMRQRRRANKPFSLMRGILHLAPNLMRQPQLVPLEISDPENKDYVYPLTLCVHSNQEKLQIDEAFADKAMLVRGSMIFADPASNGRVEEIGAQRYQTYGAHLMWAFAGRSPQDEVSIAASRWQVRDEKNRETKGDFGVILEDMKPPMYTGTLMPTKTQISDLVGFLGATKNTATASDTRTSVVTGSPQPASALEAVPVTAALSTSSISTASTSSTTSALSPSFAGKSEAIHLLETRLAWDTSRFGSPWAATAPTADEDKPLVEAVNEFVACVTVECNRAKTALAQLQSTRVVRHIFAATVDETTPRMSATVDRCVSLLMDKLDPRFNRVVSIRWMGSRVLFIVNDAAATRSRRFRTTRGASTTSARGSPTRRRTRAHQSRNCRAFFL
jgi:hypothetical protein